MPGLGIQQGHEDKEMPSRVCVRAAEAGSTGTSTRCWPMTAEKEVQRLLCLSETLLSEQRPEGQARGSQRDVRRRACQAWGQQVREAVTRRRAWQGRDKVEAGVAGAGERGREHQGLRAVRQPWATRSGACRSVDFTGSHWRILSRKLTWFDLCFKSQVRMRDPTGHCEARAPGRGG